uniref:Bestrophin homolog n=1 Tax=Panagrellus redivivus TaxID=6233 RepID=A0A7E4V1K3_PANRE
MTITYSSDVSHSSTKTVVKILCRWRGSIWKAVLPPLFIWILLYLAIAHVYRFLLTDNIKSHFESLVLYLNTSIDAYIPLTFMLGFFVTIIIGRWSQMLNGIGWIDNAAMAFATFIRGSDEETRLLRRTLIRYMVLSQTLVLRDVSIQVRKRFPKIHFLVTIGIATEREIGVLETVDDEYSRYWIPLTWCYQHLNDAREAGKITSDHLMVKIVHEVQKFQEGLHLLLKFDWIPVPLIYPQVVLLSVRLYFCICLVSRQIVVHKAGDFDLWWLPLTTIIQFIVFMGWTKVAESLLNPLGDDDEDLECNYVIDKNLTSGMLLVDQGSQAPPAMMDTDDLAENTTNLTVSSTFKAIDEP